MTGDIIAEKDDGVGAQHIGGVNDLLNPLDIHPRLASMQIGDHRDCQS